MNKRVHEIAKERGLPTKDVIERLKAAGVNVKSASSSVDEAAALRVLGNGGSPGGKPAARSQQPATGSRERAPREKSARQALRARRPARPRPLPAPARAAPRAEASERTSSERSVPAGASEQAPPAPPASTRRAQRASDGQSVSTEARRLRRWLQGAGGGGAQRSAGGGENAHKRPTRDSLQGERAPGAAGGRRRVVIDSQASRRAPGGGGPPQSNQPPRRQRRGRRRRGVYDEEAESRPVPYRGS